MADNPAETEFRNFIRKWWSSTLLTDTPQVRSIFAAGAAYALERLRDNWSKKEWQRIVDDFSEWGNRSSSTPFGDND